MAPREGLEPRPMVGPEFVDSHIGNCPKPYKLFLSRRLNLTRRDHAGRSPSCAPARRFAPVGSLSELPGIRGMVSWPRPTRHTNTFRFLGRLARFRRHSRRDFPGESRIRVRVARRSEYPVCSIGMWKTAMMPACCHSVCSMWPSFGHSSRTDCLAGRNYQPSVLRSQDSWISSCLFESHVLAKLV